MTSFSRGLSTDFGIGLSGHLCTAQRSKLSREYVKGIEVSALSSDMHRVASLRRAARKDQYRCLGVHRTPDVQQSIDASSAAIRSVYRKLG